MKNKKWLYWLVALLLVAAAGYSVIHVHKAEQANSVKMAKQASIDKKRDQKIAKQKKDQKQRARKPVDWSKPVFDRRISRLDSLSAYQEKERQGLA